MVLRGVADAQDRPVEQAVGQDPHDEELRGPREYRLRVGGLRHKVGDLEREDQVDDEDEDQTRYEMDGDAGEPASPLERKSPPEPEDRRRRERPRVRLWHLEQKRRGPRERRATGHRVADMLLHGTEQTVRGPHAENQPPTVAPSHRAKRWPPISGGDRQWTTSEPTYGPRHASFPSPRPGYLARCHGTPCGSRPRRRWEARAAPW